VNLYNTNTGTKFRKRVRSCLESLGVVGSRFCSRLFSFLLLFVPRFWLFLVVGTRFLLFLIVGSRFCNRLFSFLLVFSRWFSFFVVFSRWFSFL
jgi:hypothetical protein